MNWWRHPRRLRRLETAILGGLPWRGGERIGSLARLVSRPDAGEPCSAPPVHPQRVGEFVNSRE
jgi:hypothetical protein